MTWSDAGAESTHKPTRPSRPTYVPPHLRNNGVSVPADWDQPRLGRTGASRGRVRGRGRGRGGWRGWFNQNERWTPNQSNAPFGFDELEVVDHEEETNTVSGSINFEAYDDIPVQASGSDVPPPVSSFAEIDLGEGLNRNIKRCNYVRPTPIQRHAIPIAMAGRDLMACAQTGSGKTAAFCFPIICGILKRNHFSRPGPVACPLSLILSPTRELTSQIHEEAKKFSDQTGLKIVVAYGGAPMFRQLRNLERGVDILVATPGRLVDMIEKEKVSLRMIKYLALDEADRMLDMGFEPQIRKIVEQMDMPPSGARQTMFFSATFPNEIQRLASDFLSNYIFLAVGRVGSSTDLIAQRVEFVQDMDKRRHLMNLLRGQRENGTHGKERERALKSFKSGTTPILVATDVASRGLDVPHVAHVINFDMPKDIDDYVHRIGRTGRAGNSGLATAFFGDKNLPLAKALVELMQEANQEVPLWLSNYAERASTTGNGGQSQRFGGSRFGGNDFRSESDNYYHSSTYGNTDPNVDAYAASSNALSHAVAGSGDCAATCADSYATGWC
ncbi:DEAD-box ATP-dependent RNA helicase 52C-like isoform X2 [Alnus glutinosa]|uniref:DEAD-box ATP-dependent RNA helicase 52C-like isoform X2 n=1 Tax=Alnus glutinosa TaxID=3517 RepID=UPI002D7A3DB7|nr:DEAD-box ATP-dependent RNA helicase 52C-like isoform X2 [Alnus glutinosa]